MAGPLKIIGMSHAESGDDPDPKKGALQQPSAIPAYSGRILLP